jgi:hypothetical protein
MDAASDLRVRHIVLTPHALGPRAWTSYRERPLRSFLADPASPDGRSPTSLPSSAQSPHSSSAYPTTLSCTPATDETPPSAPNDQNSHTGSDEAGKPASAVNHLPAEPPKEPTRYRPVSTREVFASPLHLGVDVVGPAPWRSWVNRRPAMANTTSTALFATSADDPLDARTRGAIAGFLAGYSGATLG